MLGEKYLKRAARLSAIEGGFDLPSLSEARFPGTHCPLFGAVLALSQVRDASVLIVGTDECTFYSKSMAIGGDSFGPNAERCFSLVLDHTDVSFGCRDKLEEALREIRRDYGTRVVFVISTCVVELIGDDLESILENLETELDMILPLVHTEHFKCENHLPGIERTLTACFRLMERADEAELALQDGDFGGLESSGAADCCGFGDSFTDADEPDVPGTSCATDIPATPRTKRLNLLGHRHGDFANSELAGLILLAGAEISLVLPSECSIREIEEARKADLNLVTDAVGLPLARKMRRRFGIPFVYFDRFVTPATIAESYAQLVDELLADDANDPAANDNLNAARRQALEHYLAEAKDGLSELEAETMALLAGQPYIYGNTPLLTLELNAYLAELGLIPQLIQLRDFDAETEDGFRQRILAKTDPYVTKNANISPLQHVYDVLHPHFYIGHEFAARLKAKGIIVLTMDRLGRFHGYQLCKALLKLLQEADHARKALLAGDHNAGANLSMMGMMANMNGPAGKKPGGHGAPSAAMPGGMPPAMAAALAKKGQSGKAEPSKQSTSAQAQQQGGPQHGTH